MRRFAATLASLVITAGALVVSTYDADADTRSERDRVRAERAEVAASVNALEASQGELTTALRILDENLRVEQGRLADAEQAVRAAEAQVVSARRGIRASISELRRLDASMTQAAVDAYVRPPSSSMAAVLEAEDASAAAERQAYEGLRSNRDADLVDQIRTTKAELQARRRIATAARERAERKRAEVRDRLRRVDTARAQQSRLIEQVETRMNNQIARANELQAKDKELSDRLYRESTLR